MLVSLIKLVSLHTLALSWRRIVFFLSSLPLSLSLSLMCARAVSPSLPSESAFRFLCRSVALSVHVCVRVAWGRDGGRDRSDSIRVLLQENTTVYYTNKLKS